MSMETTNMPKGSVYWANSYIILKSGQKIYLENNVGEIEEKMRSNEQIILLNISDLDGNAIRVVKDSIVQYENI